MIKALVLTSVFSLATGFMSSSTNGARNSAMTMAAERSKSIPFLLKPAKVVTLEWSVPTYH